MSASCCRSSQPDPDRNHTGYRKVLWIVLLINALMFLIEVILGFTADSASLQADDLDFLGDAANYAISLSVAGLALYHRARALMVKGISMGLFGFWVIGHALWHFAHGNDVIGNCAVLLTALGVFGISRGWPDVLVAVIMGTLAVHGASVVSRVAYRELVGAGA